MPLYMIIHYFKSIILSAKKNPFFYSINLIGFITGLMVLTIILTFVFQELRFDKFHNKVENIYRIHSGGYGVTPPCFGEILKDGIPEINGIIRFVYCDLAIADQNKEIHLENTYYTDPEVFKVFSFTLLSGNVDSVLEAPFSIVINKSTANLLFGIDNPIGETIQGTDGSIYTITGIMEDIPYNSHIQSSAFVSIETLRITGGEEAFDCSSWGSLTYILKSEKSNVINIEKKINSILHDYRFVKDDDAFSFKLQPLKKVYFDIENNKFDDCKHGNLQTIILYSGIAVLLLALVIINYINLTTAISGGRIKEIALRKINGANRIDIIKQALLESTVIVVISYIITLSAIELLLPHFCRLLNISIAESLNRSLLYLYYVVGIVVVGILTGLIPGILLARTDILRAKRNEAFLYSGGIQRKILLIVQLIILTVLLNSTFITNRQIKYVLTKDLGFQYENVIYFKLDSTLLNKREVLKDNLIAKPEVELVSFSNGLIGEVLVKFNARIANDDNARIFSGNSIDPDYIDLYKIELKQGRNFSWDFESDSNRCCLINEAACKAFNLKNPIGEEINMRTVVGVVNDFNFASLHNHIEPLVLLCSNKGDVVQIKISEEDQEETIAYIQNTCNSISHDFECNISFLDSRIKELYKSEQDLRNSFKIYSIITFIVALLGFVGLIQFTIKKKTKEVTIRKLFGATLNENYVLLAKDHIGIILISNILAIPITYYVMNSWLRNFQFRISMEYIIFLNTFLITLMLTLLAILVVALKIDRISVKQSFRYE